MCISGVSTDVRNVRDQLSRFHYNLSSLIATVQHSVQELQTNYQQQTTAQQALNNHQNQEMVHLSNRIDALVDKNAAQDAKVEQLEEMVKCFHLQPYCFQNTRFFLPKYSKNLHLHVS